MHDPALIAFRPLCMDDLPRVSGWLAAGPARRWFARRDMTYEEVADHFGPIIRGERPTLGYIVIYAGEPAGYVQTYRLRDHPRYWRALQVEPGAAGLDLFIGREDLLYRGLGAAVARRFLREVVFGATDASTCVVGPDPQNRAAIRAYEKAGFRYLKTVRIPDEDSLEYVMQADRVDFE